MKGNSQFGVLLVQTYIENLTINYILYATASCCNLNFEQMYALFGLSLNSHTI